MRCISGPARGRIDRMTAQHAAAGQLPLKYWAGMPWAVTLAGTLHGVLFVALVLMLAMAVRKVPLSIGLAVIGMAAAIIPFGPFWFDRKLHLQETARS